ncbi:hypothetical protein K440DRAFT_673713 [Wilcoxina mikolae CBS 423.85]|nr:hypothetical protein K440DRAFT_673713 [Wilcoxina mikolae CBS 423.85]
MDGRPSSAPPLPPKDSPTPLSIKTGDLGRRAKSSIGGSSPDSIEEAATFLFHRVRALLSPDNDDDNNGTTAQEVECSDENLRSKTPAAASSLYYGDEGESGDSESFDSGKETPKRGNMGPQGVFNKEKHEIRYESSDPDLDTVVRIRDVIHKTIASSIVKESGSTLGRPHFSHTSIPADIGRISLQQRTKNRSLGKMTPSPAASAVGTIGALAEGASSSEEEGEETLAGGVDPERIREKFMSSPKPIKSMAPHIRVVYDDSSSPASCLNSPDLFSRPLHIGSPVKRSPSTPTNTIASPQPLIGIIPATDSSNSPISIDSTGNVKVNGQSTPGGVCTPPEHSMVGHTGATTPEEEGVLGTATVNRGTMTEFDYDEYAEEEYGPPGVSVMPSTSETPQKSQSNLDLGDTSQNFSKYSTDTFAALSSYDDSDPQVVKGPPVSSTLYQEYIRSDPSKASRTGSRNRARTEGEFGSTSRTPMQLEDGKVAVTTQSFTRIITDLEDMLNQALEIAGRAVKDSSSALDQRDASIRSLQSSTRGSLISSGFEGTERAVTAPESLADPEENNNLDDHSAADAPDSQSMPDKVHRNVNPSSSGAVYSDNGELTSQSNLEYDRRRKGTRRSPLPIIDIAESERERAWHSNLHDISSEQVSTVARKAFSPDNSFNQISGPEQRFRMEVGRDGEIILVRIPLQKLSVENGPPLPTVGETSDPIPRRYKGGWEWSLWSKRFTATIACGVVGLIGWIVRSYYAELPQIEEHLEISPNIASLGNSMFFLGLAIPTSILWPLPLLHGRKPYLLLSISLLLPLQLPQALSLPPYTTDSQTWDRSMQPYVACLLFFRSISGLILGFAFMNGFATILDLFGPDTGACCRGGVVFNNRVPLEGQNQYNAVTGGEAGVRTGIWVGVFTWMFVASPGLGYLFGKIAVATTTPAWGFWTVAILTGFILALILVAPEVRPPWKTIRIGRSASRRGQRPAIAGIAGSEVVERGEIKMVMFGSSPRWWWEEVFAGFLLTWKMMHQYGFLLLAVYFGWVFGHLVLVMMLLASLIDFEYKFAPTDIGLAIFAFPLGALLVIPTQLSMFYLTNFRHRSSVTMHNSNYGHTNVGQHPYRWALRIGAIMLPLSSILLAISASGSTHFMVPVFFAAVVSFSGALVVAESYIILMDNFDISDLPEPSLNSGSGSISQGANLTGNPHGTPRPMSLHPSDDESFATSHPCLSSGLAICHGLAFLFAAMAVGVSTHIVEGIGIRKGLSVYSAVTCIVTIGLAYALWRNKEVRLVEVFNDNEQERNAKVSLLQRSWGSRWTEVNGMEWWEDENAV